jgi:hypothetical protein
MGVIYPAFRRQTTVLMKHEAIRPGETEERLKILLGILITLFTKYNSNDQVMKMRWPGQVVGKPDERKPTRKI